HPALHSFPTRRSSDLCGDSEGDCSQTEFDTELAGYRAAFRALKNHDFIDSDHVYIFGSSNGGGFAPLVPEAESEQAQVRGYITIDRKSTRLNSSHQII